MSKMMFFTVTFCPFSLNKSFISQQIHVSLIGNWKQHPTRSVYAKKIGGKTLNRTFSLTFRILQKVGSPKKQVALVELHQLHHFFPNF